jgi:subtilisin family serine protease
LFLKNNNNRILFSNLKTPQTHMKKTHLAIAIMSATIFASCSKEIKEGSNPQTEESVTTASNKASEAAVSDHYMPNEILVKFKAGISEDAKSQAFSRIGGNVAERILTKTMQRFGDNEGIYLLHTPLAVLDAINKVKGIDIEYAEPNYIYQHQVTSNDTYYTNGSLWGMHGDAITPYANQYGSQADEAWAAGHTGSSDVYVGVIDEGGMFTHVDLDANFWTNPFDLADGADNDGNGYVDDVHGWDFDGNDNSTFDGTQDDHGTHVSGTIGAEGGNGVGVVGVNWSVKIISAKFLGRNGGTTANAIKAVDYITNLKAAHGLNIVATNNSWGGGGFSQSLKGAIDRAGSANILFIAAAGNSSVNIDNSPSYPASYTSSNLIAVAALTSNGGLASYSNYGAASVDLGAPGSGIYSTVPARSQGQIVSAYASYSGTSMATPHVTGAAALYASTHPGATAAQIKDAILNSVTPTTSLAGKTSTGGRLNVSGF